MVWKNVRAIITETDTSIIIIIIIDVSKSVAKTYSMKKIQILLFLVHNTTVDTTL